LMENPEIDGEITTRSPSAKMFARQVYGRRISSLRLPPLFGRHHGGAGWTDGERCSRVLRFIVFLASPVEALRCPRLEVSCGGQANQVQHGSGRLGEWRGRAKLPPDGEGAFDPGAGDQTAARTEHQFRWEVSAHPAGWWAFEVGRQSMSRESECLRAPSDSAPPAARTLWAMGPKAGSGRFVRALDGRPARSRSHRRFPL
jgi:hypothetical protein